MDRRTDEHTCADGRINSAAIERILDGRWKMRRETCNTGIPPHLPTLVYLSASTELKINTNSFNEKTSGKVRLAMLRCKYRSFAVKQSKGVLDNISKPVGQ